MRLLGPLKRRRSGPAELLAFCKERIAGYKCPHAIEIMDELPKNPLGKLLKTELRARFWVGKERKVN